VVSRGFFRELLDFTSDIDYIMNEHLKTASVFKGTSKTIQNEILDSMFAACQTEIRNQINEADFLPIQCDETTDVASHCQMVVMKDFGRLLELQRRQPMIYRKVLKTL
jgi:hypothetical protein